MSEIYDILLPLFIGFGLLFTGLKFIEKRKRVINNGDEAEGIVFGFELSGSAETQARYPIIRFVTKEGLWITERADIGVPSFLLKQGQAVKIIYNPVNPKEFIYKTSIDYTRVSYFIIVAGILSFITGLWFAYKYLTK